MTAEEKEIMDDTLNQETGQTEDAELTEDTETSDVSIEETEDGGEEKAEDKKAAKKKSRGLRTESKGRWLSLRISENGPTGKSRQCLRLELKA